MHFPSAVASRCWPELSRPVSHLRAELRTKPAEFNQNGGVDHQRPPPIRMPEPLNLTSDAVRTWPCAR